MTPLQCISIDAGNCLGFRHDLRRRCFYLSQLLEFSHNFTAILREISHCPRIAEPLGLWMSGSRDAY